MRWGGRRRGRRIGRDGGPGIGGHHRGTYTATGIDGGGFLPNGATEPARVTSCGPDCFTLMISAGPSDMRPAGPVWTGTLVGDGFGSCPRTIDPNSLIVTESCPSFGMNVSWTLVKERVGVSMTTVIRHVAVVAALFGAAVVHSPLAHGDTRVPSGSYAVAYPTLGMERTWTMTPCGDDCTVASSERSESFVQAWEFRLENGRWVFRGPGTFACGTGATSPADFDYGFDAVSLAGEGAATMRSDACGDAVGTTYRFPFELTANS